MRDLASPVGAFVREECERKISVDALHSAYKVWADNNGHSRTSKQVFGHDLHAAVPAIKKPEQRSVKESDKETECGAMCCPRGPWNANIERQFQIEKFQIPPVRSANC